ncbi:mechanosensitive ion channel protein 10-like isoform X1 [Lycium ferocissimum]|uniref:mechanosensitive ion channel protein 10-like isoform X1 n=1 Tax=Lycium ferocissimum TaxID=112874 RepID=UPI002815C1A0|nr:mechanosensitive ion channel protein 10-like isoform X1 [Lycium ferocissimum]XP_059297467.1 mechanosensitive ion channel protein 10-like isoform X1 [Lycium ferocissimum]XP_059297468.1 mechanosensitive ion channel protein 10-like isoform X1 [Lycium ferocissimum]
MDAKGKATKISGEIRMAEMKRNPDEVVVLIPGDEQDSKNQKSITSPEVARSSASISKPPKIPTNETLTRRKSLARSVYSKPKSRFGEQSLAIDGSLLDELEQQSTGSPYENVSNNASPSAKVDSSGNSLKETMRKVSISVTPKTPLMASPGGPGGVDEHEEIYKKVNIRNKMKYKRVKLKVLVEWLVFLLLLGCLIASLLVDKLQNFTLWDLEIWKWIVLVMVTFSGMLVTKWFIHFIVLLIELNFLLRKKVLYFVFGLKKSVQVFIWLSLVLLTWVLLFAHGVKRSRMTNKIIDYITWTVASLLIGAFLWLLKTLMLKVLASSFHVNTFFDRIQQAIFHQYILLTLSGPPVMDSAQMLGRSNSVASQLSLCRTKKGKDGKQKKEKEMIDINKLHQMKREKISAWTMKMLVDVISNSGLSTISGSIGDTDYGGGNEQADKEINNEEEAIAAAVHIFKNVAQPGSKYIDDNDLRRFMIKEEMDIVLPLIDVADTGQIDRKALTEWVVKVYQGRKALSHALNDTKTAVRQLNTIVTGILIVIIIIIWLLLVGIATTKVIFFLSSQLVVASFLFGNTCKCVFEGIVFVFVMHPFDVGDRCVVDGVQMIVEEMNILTTVFLRFDNEKIYYPNSVLATKPISNFFRSPDMSDAFEFSIDFRTHLEKIGVLKEKIKKHLERNSQYWHSNHNVVVKEIENLNKIKMALFFNHTMNFQNFGEKNRRRTELILEMKKIFEELNIKYDLLPQEVHLVEWKQEADNR